jgi:uncharacterized protein with PhoU and TrkA domain
LPEEHDGLYVRRIDFETGKAHMHGCTLKQLMMNTFQDVHMILIRRQGVYIFVHVDGGVLQTFEILMNPF